VHVNPAESLATWQQRLKDLRSPYPDRRETFQALQAAVTRADLEASTLSHRMQGDPEAGALYQELILYAELGRGTLPKAGRQG
jgi:hypothetical protein